MKYTAITIGPIIKTLSLVRKPRELWSASYLFSYLMGCIIDAVPEQFEIISPAKLNKKKSAVGLYPDRVFIKHLELKEAEDIIEQSRKAFASALNLNNAVNDYFNIMSVSIEASSDGEAVRTLNEKLDVMELCCTPTNEVSSQEILSLIKKIKHSPLFKLAFESEDFPIEMLSDIASSELSSLKPTEWGEARVQSNKIEKDKNSIVNEEDHFYLLLKENCPEEYKTYHKYICVIQADGDNMGSVVSNIPNGKLSAFSKDLLNFGEKSCKIIEAFGGLPIYAGGDDLLFIAPVVGKESRNILDLVKNLDKEYQTIRVKVENYHILKEGKPLTTSMSYGISISYYKFPLYEALESARNLLFENAKHIEGKNALAWKLQKNSGSSFSGRCSKSDEVYKLFEKVVKTTSEDHLVTAVAHKIRVNDSLLGLWKDKDSEHISLRLDAFYDKTMEFNSKSKAEQDYLTATKNLLLELYKTKDIERITSEIYGMLRTAKFINGEEENHE